ncbi:unnamed protein product [Hymenolepis diminuta]|nr:unnamed protein product [Hymenolepis diminuta]
MRASMNGHKETIETLLLLGAQTLNIRKKAKDTAKSLALKNGHKEICNIIEDYENV